MRPRPGSWSARAARSSRWWEGPEGVGSIDLVAEDDGELVFVDVVARRSTDGFPEAHIGRELREILTAKWLGEHCEEYCTFPSASTTWP